MELSITELWATPRLFLFLSGEQASVAMASVKDVDQQNFVVAFAAFLKKSGKLKVPEWVDCVKTGSYKELAPSDEDWFYTRAASIARHLYMRAPVGVGTFCKIYGGRQRHGVKPSHFCRASASVGRKCLQALEGLKLVKKTSNGGRKLTPQGRRDLDRIANQLKGNKTSRKTVKKKEKKKPKKLSQRHTQKKAATKKEAS